MIVRNTAVAALLAIVVVLILPRKYTATATLMPPGDQNKSPMANLVSEVSVPGISLPSSASSSEILAEILLSRSVNERVLNRRFVHQGDTLQLYRILRFPSLEAGLIRMRSRARFLVSKQGIITIAVELGDRELAARVKRAVRHGYLCFRYRDNGPRGDFFNLQQAAAEILQPMNQCLKPLGPSVYGYLSVWMGPNGAEPSLCGWTIHLIVLAGSSSGATVTVAVVVTVAVPPAAVVVTVLVTVAPSDGVPLQAKTLVLIRITMAVNRAINTFFLLFNS